MYRHHIRLWSLAPLLCCLAACALEEDYEPHEYTERSDCDAPTWTPGQWYVAGDVVHYAPDGQLYIAEHDNPGYDPTISTWFWDPTSCGDGGGLPPPGDDCDAPTWTPGQWYVVGDVVHYAPDGQLYIAEHENPGYDPTISTWFWDPTSCGGGGDGDPPPPPPPPGDDCNVPTWTPGQWYVAGDVVHYAADGQLYIAEHDNPGYDPTISTWFWDPTSCGDGGDGGGPPPPPPPPGDGVGSLISAAQFATIFPNAAPFYTYSAFIEATQTYPAFAGSGDPTTDRRELAAFLANISHETGGLVYIEEIAMGEYCSPSVGCPCAPGRKYYGRGPIQLSWNYNYCAAGAALGLNLQANPDLVAQDATVAWQTALWFWMTSTGAGTSTCHDAMVGGSGFGQTIQTINGALECGGGNPAQVQSRIDTYLSITAVLGVDPGGNLGC
ncbi:MAG: glycoside hydrolase family 19 protein [Myxococcota bacterium]